jgi:hypothetical protein
MIRNQIDPARWMFQWLMVLFDLWYDKDRDGI